MAEASRTLSSMVQSGAISSLYGVGPSAGVASRGRRVQLNEPEEEEEEARGRA